MLLSCDIKNYVDMVRQKKKPAGAVSLFGGVDIFGGSKQDEQDKPVEPTGNQEKPSTQPKTTPKPKKSDSSMMGGGGLFAEDGEDDIFSFQPSSKKNKLVTNN